MTSGATAINISSSTAWVAGGVDAVVTPSVACGLGWAPVSAKGWVLAMLARSRAARGSGPEAPGWSSPALVWLRQRRVRSAPRLSLRPSCPAQENRTRGGGRQHPAGDTPGQRERSDHDHHQQICHPPSDSPSYHHL